MTLAMMTDGVSRIVQLAQEIDSAAGEQRVKFIDIGSFEIARLKLFVYSFVAG